MTKERRMEIEFIRSEIVGPARPMIDYDGADRVKFTNGGKFKYPDALPGKGIPLFWAMEGPEVWQEIVHYNRENPLNKYGSGMLFPGGVLADDLRITLGSGEGGEEPVGPMDDDRESLIDCGSEDREHESNSSAEPQADNDFEVNSPDIYRPSTMGISFCLDDSLGTLIIELPESKLFAWQAKDDLPFQVNGCYEKCEKIITNDGTETKHDAWRRSSVSAASVSISTGDFVSGQLISREVDLHSKFAIKVRVDVFPRKIRGQWVVTVVLRNDSAAPKNNQELITRILFQALFEVSIERGKFARYPEGVRRFDEFDDDEQSLSLLYEDSATWAIGHGCSAAWDTSPSNEVPDILYADVMPAVELPSMTPDVEDDAGDSISLSMRLLSELPEYDPAEQSWQALNKLASLYDEWIEKKKESIHKLDSKLAAVAERHMNSCSDCLARIEVGLELLKSDKKVRKAFKLANESMLLQQISAKKLEKRNLSWNGRWVEPVPPLSEEYSSPASVFKNKLDLLDNNLGNWRAFQLSFLLLSLDGLVNESASYDRDVVDLIWFPTGGGKTEAYLGVAAFYMFYQRLKMSEGAYHGKPLDGTNVFMRYTLRMLTTQQFQRAASLICSMEYIRANRPELNLGETKFSLGLWIGGDGTPNKCDQARSAINAYKKDGDKGNPLVIAECPWCKSEIGRLNDKPDKISQTKWNKICVAGITEVNRREPVLKCSDTRCHFGGEYDTLPIEVIDERIYENPPSMFIGTADKFAMLSYKPEAGSLFGRKHGHNGAVQQLKAPPGLIIQDEFHLISGALGTMYGMYEGVIEKLCSVEMDNGRIIKPKIVASTATIRGANDQVQAVYARDEVQLFPSPGLLMGDSFFGRYATETGSEELKPGRLYLGLHANSYGSVLTAQVRAFTAALFCSCFMEEEKRDPWWTLLAFYNSLRELGGARTLFDSDIASRIKNYSYRYGLDKDQQRYLSVEELTSRKSQAQLVDMMDKLTIDWDKKGSIDACLASNIIEVGVDIDRLSLMSVVGQPKSTAQYIQVTGRVGRKWWERPGLIMTIFNPSKSRDRSHFEQFHSYHRRLYERVEPTSATPFSVESVKRTLNGVLLLWARQCYESDYPSGHLANYRDSLKVGSDLLKERCESIVDDENEQRRVIDSINKTYDDLIHAWDLNPQRWQEYPQKSDGEYLMLWPGQFATDAQKRKGFEIPTSMRNVDGSGYMQISPFYISERE